MGTNYYWHEKEFCAGCGRGFDGIHIGKSSAGWVFALRIWPEDGISELHDWVRKFAQDGSYILDEYGDRIMPFAMLATIAARSWTKNENPGAGYKDWADFHRSNGSIPGPCNLLRSSKTSEHGAGTYDLCRNEFS